MRLLNDTTKCRRRVVPWVREIIHDLAADVGETRDVAAKEPQIAERVSRLMREAHVDNEHWKLPAR